MESGKSMSSNAVTLPVLSPVSAVLSCCKRSATVHFPWLHCRPMHSPLFPEQPASMDAASVTAINTAVCLFHFFSSSLLLFIYDFIVRLPLYRSGIHAMYEILLQKRINTENRQHCYDYAGHLYGFRRHFWHRYLHCSSYLRLNWQ